VEKIKEYKQKVGKINQTINQRPALRLKHDKIQAWWASQISCQRAYEKRYDGVNVPKWNFENEPFFVWWIIQKKGDIFVSGVIKDYMLPWGVVGKWKFC